MVGATDRATPRALRTLGASPSAPITLHLSGEIDIFNRAQGGTVALAAPRPYMSQLLRITGLDRSLPMVA